MANTTPIFPLTPKVSSVLVTTANTSSAGGGTVGTDIFLAFTAGSSGSFISKVRWIPVATTPTAMSATVGRIFKSTVTSGSTTSSNTILLAETTLTALNADNASAAVPYFDVPINQPVDASATILVTNHATPAANTNWRAVVFAVDY